MLLSLNKPYTVDPAPSGSYPDDGGVELTNGLIDQHGCCQVSCCDVGWSLLDPTIRIDLESIYHIDSVKVRYSRDNDCSIGAPSVIVYGSTNDSDWTELGSDTFIASDNTCNWGEITGLSGKYRYIKFAFTRSNKWTMLSELEVYGESPPTLDTTATTDITQESATLNGDITDTGGENADERGFVYDTVSHGDPGNIAPASSDYPNNVKETGDYGTGIFNLSATSLDVGQIYYVRAYAHNSGGYAYGDEVSFETLTSFGFEWLVKKIPSFGLEWLVQKLHSSSFGFLWITGKTQRRYNLLTYPLFIKTPTVSTFTFTSSVTGTLDSLAVDFSNTGSSGSTIIKVYLADILEYTYTVTANNLAKNETITLSDNNISLGDKIRVEIESVATGIGTLHVAVQEKTFTERLEITKKCNVFNNTEYEDEIFYGDASEWRLYINQPLSSVIRVYAKSGTNIYYLTTALDYGDINANYISITPDTISGYDELVISTKTVIDNKVKEIVIPLRFYENRADYPKYAHTSFTMDIYLSAIKLYYSWDNITWYSTDIDSSTTTISNLPATAGTYTFYTRYFYDDDGKKVIADTTTIIYNPDPIDVYIDQNIVNYSDSMPADRVDIYADDVLEKQIDIPCTISGFDNYTFQSAKTDPKLEEPLTIWVATDGDDDNGIGNYDKPYKHLYKAIQLAVRDNVTIILKSGVYNEENLEGTYPTITNPITIESETGNFEDVVIHASGWSSYSYCHSFLYHNPFVGTVYLKNITIKIEDTGDISQKLYNGFYQTNLTLLNVFIDGQNNRLSIYVHSGALRFYKVTIRNASGLGRVIWSQGTSYYKNCIFENIEPELCGSVPTEADYNCLYNVTDNGFYSPGAHDITSDPKFTATNVATLESDSPCRDTGIVVTDYVENYGGSAPDMGSYEFNWQKIYINTDGAENVTLTSATIKGILYDLGGEDQVKVWFEWGVTDSYGNETTKEIKNLIGDFSANISGLTHNTCYHYRACVSKTDDSGIMYGSDETMITGKLNQSSITLDAGYFYEKDIKYTFAEQTLGITETPDFNNPILYYVIGFNTTTKEMELKKVTYETLDLTFEELTTAFFIPIWQFQINSYFPNNDIISDGVFEIMSADKIFYPIKLPTIYGEASTKYRIYDVTGRYRDIEFNSIPTKDDYLYSLTVTDGDGNEIKQGQITQETILTYTMEELE